MVKYCVVLGCRSDSVVDRKNRLKKVPKDILKEKWSKALSQELTPNHCVCEKHFHKEDIHNIDRFIINGTETVIPRVRWTLKNDKVVPIKPSEEPLHIESSLQVNVVIKLDCSPTSIVSSGITLEEIIGYFSLILISGWCYHSVDAELLFIHMNILTRKEDICRSVADDLSIKVSFSQRPQFPADITILSIDDIKIYMESLEATILCEGTGLQQRSIGTIFHIVIFAELFKKVTYQIILRKKLNHITTPTRTATTTLMKQYIKIKSSTKEVPIKETRTKCYIDEIL